MGANKTVFLDRDGTISIDEGYTSRPEDMRIYTGAGKALGRLKEAGFRLVVVTNQSAIGRNFATVADVEATNQECLRQLEAEDAAATIDAVLYCPHLPSAGCSCRKPKAGLLDQLSWGFPAAESYLIGDKCSDIEFGMNAGLALGNCILVETGEGGTERETVKARFGDGVPAVADLETATELILRKG